MGFPHFSELSARIFDRKTEFLFASKTAPNLYGGSFDKNDCALRLTGCGIAPL